MSRRILIAILLLFLGVGLTLGLHSLIRIGGPRFDPQVARDLIELRQLTYSLSPAVEALQDAQKEGFPLPDDLDDLQGLPAHFVETFPQLHYSHQEGSFSLYYKLSWDAFLFFEESDGVWIFDPGDGSAATPILP